MSHVKNVPIQRHEKVFFGTRQMFWGEERQRRSKYPRLHTQYSIKSIEIDSSFMHPVQKSSELCILCYRYIRVLQRHFQSE